MDLRLPHHLVPGTWIVLEGPRGAGKTAQLDNVWRASHGLGHGRKALFDSEVVFTQRPARLEWHRSHQADVVRRALTGGRSVFQERCWWSDVVDSGDVIDPAVDQAAQREAGLDRLPDVIFLVNPQTDALTAGRYAELAAIHSDRTAVLVGHRGDVGEEMFAQLHRRGFYFAKPPRSTGVAR